LSPFLALPLPLERRGFEKNVLLLEKEETFFISFPSKRGRTKGVSCLSPFFEERLRGRILMEKKQ